MKAPQAVSFRSRCSLTLEQDLALIDPDASPDLIASVMCWHCGRPGRKQSECFIKGVLDCHDLLMYHTPQDTKLLPHPFP